MLYIYYMKNNIFRLSLLAVFLCFSALAGAQITVVRVDGSSIYLDTSSAAKAPYKGQSFKVIVSTEKLTNPQTGKDLGDIYHYSPVGKITEVQPLYAVGEMANPAGIAVGQQALLEESADPAPAAAPQPQALQIPGEVRKKIIYAPIAQEIISVTEADVSAPGAQNLVTLSSDRQVTVWSRGENNTLKEVFSYFLPSSAQPITISAVPVKEGNAQIFVTVYTPARKKVSAFVLENKNGSLEKTAELPFFVKEQGCGAEKTVWAQTPFVSEEYPGNARQVVYEDGKFKASKKSFATLRNWLTGVARYGVEKEGADNLIYTSSTGTLRMVLQNGKRTESKDLFASSPNRVKYKQEILEFYPSVQVFGPQGDATIAAVENDAKIGLLAQMFGQYQNGKIHFLTYENGQLTVQDTTPLDGVVYDTACSQRAVLAAEVLPNGNSRIVEIFK